MKVQKLIATPISLAGASIGMGMIGEALGSEGLKSAGTATGNFIVPAVNISMAGYTIKQLKSLKGK